MAVSTHFFIFLAYIPSPTNFTNFVEMRFIPPDVCQGKPDSFSQKGAKKWRGNRVNEAVSSPISYGNISRFPENGLSEPKPIGLSGKPDKFS